MTARYLPVLLSSVLFLASQAFVGSASAVVTLVDVTITSSEPDPTTASPIPFTFTFGEAVSGFDQTDIVTTNGSITDFTGGGDTYTAQVSPVQSGLVGVSIAEAAAVGDISGDDSEADSFAIRYIAPSQPDLRAGAKSNPATHQGNDNYALVTHKQKRIKKKGTFFLSLQNDGSETDTYSLDSQRSRKFKVKYSLSGSGNVTAGLASGSLNLTLAPGEIRIIKAKVSPKKKSFRSQTFTDRIQVTTITGPNSSDQAKVKLGFLPNEKRVGNTTPNTPVTGGPGINP